MNNEIETKEAQLQRLLAKEKELKAKLESLKEDLNDTKNATEILKRRKENLPIAISALTRLAALHGSNELENGEED